MAVLNIRKAKRAGARVVIVLAGVSGSGKTHTALELALGLTNFKPEKIGFIDAENRRGSIYADIFKGEGRTHRTDEEFLIGDLYAPFSPDRYIAAIREFQEAGVEVCIIDSGSHEWEGIGGVLEIADGDNPNRPNWLKGKKEHKKFMNVLLTCDMHIILCLRARNKTKPEKQMVNGVEKTVFVDHGLEPICEGNVMFEATISLMMEEGGKKQIPIKAGPTELASHFCRQIGYLTPEDGFALRNWLGGATELDPEVERFRNILINSTDQGLEKLKSLWEKDTPARVRKVLGVAFLETCKASAAEYKRLADSAHEENEESRLNNAIKPNDDDPAQAFGTTPVADTAAATKSDKPVVKSDPVNETKPAPTAKPVKEEKPKPGRNPAAPEQEKPDPPANPPAKKSGITLF